MENSEETKLVDPAFSGVPITGIAPAVSSDPKSIFKIGDDKVFVIKKYLQLVWDVYCKANDKGRLINVSEMLDNSFSLFSTTQLRADDGFWKEHASANLRELTDDLSRENYSEALTCIDKDDPDIANSFKNIEDLRSKCLHNCAHFRTTACIDNAKEFFKITDQLVGDDEIFDQIVTSYLISIYAVVSKCKKT